jgi:hypothetical protein
VNEVVVEPSGTNDALRDPTFAPTAYDRLVPAATPEASTFWSVTSTVAWIAVGALPTPVISA